jgi:hypothetical protein
MIYTALYLPSDIENEAIEFQLEIQGDYPETKEGFKQLAKAFTAAVDGLGKTLLFPQEILDKIDDDSDRLDRLLQDTEFISNQTYYLKMPSSQMYFSFIDADVYQLCGVSETMCIFMTPNREVINLIKINQIKSVFGKIEA